jgi:hypothetical protein
LTAWPSPACRCSPAARFRRHPEEPEGAEYYVRRYYDGTGNQQETYLGLVGEADAWVESIRAQIGEVKALQKDVRLLMREGFQSADAPAMPGWPACTGKANNASRSAPVGCAVPASAFFPETMALFHA